MSKYLKAQAARAVERSAKFRADALTAACDLDRIKKEAAQLLSTPVYPDLLTPRHALPASAAWTSAHYEEAQGLITRFGDVTGVARHIVGQMIANPANEERWRSVAGACHELFWANWQ